MGLTDGNSKITQLVDRVGFIKLAQEKKYPIIPVLCFGEKWLVDSFEIQWLKKLLKGKQLSASYAMGRSFFGIGLV